MTLAEVLMNGILLVGFGCLAYEAWYKWPRR